MVNRLGVWNNSILLNKPRQSQAESKGIQPLWALFLRLLDFYFFVLIFL